jgi:hypothetical protein
MRDNQPVNRQEILGLDGADLGRMVDERLTALDEEEAIAVLEHPFCNTAMCQKLARASRLTAFYSVRFRLVIHQATPQADATKLVHYLYWPDLLRVSTNVQVRPTVRRAADNRLLTQLDKLAVGERVSSARQCSRELIKVLLFDDDERVFEALLINPRLIEDDIIRLIASDRASGRKLALIAGDRRWGQRYAVRFGLASNPATPKAVAASQLRHLRRDDLSALHSHPRTSVYLRRCIERLEQP